MTALAAPADLALRMDANTIAELLSDSGTPVADITTDSALLAILEDASGRLESACSVANLYTPEDLANLTGNGLALRKRIVCDLAKVMLIERRPEKWPNSESALSRIKEEAEQFLDRVRKGERLFPTVQKVADAGLPPDGPTTASVQNENRITTRVKNYYPATSRMPLGR